MLLARVVCFCFFFFFQAEDGIRDVERSRGLGDVYKRQDYWGICLYAGWKKVSGGSGDGGTADTGNSSDAKTETSTADTGSGSLP